MRQAPGISTAFPRRFPPLQTSIGRTPFWRYSQQFLNPSYHRLAMWPSGAWERVRLEAAVQPGAERIEAPPGYRRSVGSLRGQVACCQTVRHKPVRFGLPAVDIAVGAGAFEPVSAKRFAIGVPLSDVDRRRVAADGLGDEDADATGRLGHDPTRSFAML